MPGPIGQRAITDWTKGQKLTADKLSEPGRNINKINAFLSGLRQPGDADNFCPPIARARFVGVIRDGGPNGEDDYTDSRYWVEKLSPDMSSDATAILAAKVEPIEDFKFYKTVTNLAECTFDSGISGSTHKLSDGDVVEVLLLYLQTDPPTKFWCISKAMPDLMLVKVYKDSGSAGSDSASCTFTYTIKDWKTGMTVLGTTRTPLRPRYTNCEYDQPTDGSYGLAFNDGSSWQLYEAVMEKPKGDVVTVVSDFQVDGSTQKLQKKTRSVLVLETAAESSWTDVHVGEACT